MSDLGNTAGASPTEDFHLTADTVGRKSLVSKIWPAILALLLTVGLLAGYFYLRGRNERALAARLAAEKEHSVSAPPEAQVFQDEVRLAGGQAVVGGTVRNISGERLGGLSVEIELIGRGAQVKELRRVAVEPKDLRPGEDGRYSLKIEPKLWSGASIAKLHSAERGTEVPFKPEAGEQRPAEGRPAPKVIVAPRPKGKGDDFLNTPDTPIRIP